jgi:RNA polymerase sigma-70 factor, ECF subfamily
MTKTEKQQAFARFVREHQAPLRGFLRMLGVRADSVDDLAQETFMVAFRELDRFDDREDFGTWLRGIARNLVRNEVRKSARRGRIMDGELTEHLMAEAERDQADAKFEETDFHNLRDCLEKLPDKSRRLISARYGDEWKSSFLADQFQMSATAVRLALMRIRRQLKACIEKDTRHA